MSERLDTGEQIAAAQSQVQAGRSWDVIRIWLRALHRWLGLSLGLLLALMGATGALMSFQDELMRFASPGIVTVAVRAEPRLLPSALLARASAQRAGRAVAALTLYADPHRAAQLEFAPVQRGQRHGETSFVDPYSGQLLGLARGQVFFAAVRQLHRVLALSGPATALGRWLTGTAALGLVFFALSGLYLHWPRPPQAWRGWLSLDRRGRGAAFQRALHVWLGTWLLLLYLLSAGTGLWWSFDSYRQALAWALSGEPPPAKRPPLPPAASWPAPPPNLDRSWQRYLQALAGGYRQATLRLPAHAGGEWLIDGVGVQARYLRMSDRFRFQGSDGALLAVDRYAARPLGRRLLGVWLALHDGSFFGWPGRILLLLSSSALLLLAWSGWASYLGRRRSRGRMAEGMPAGPPAMAQAVPDAIVYAGQNGRAEHLARLSAQAFGREAPPLWPLADLTAERLATARRLLFVVSTYGDGGPPDAARRFARQRMSAAAACRGLEYALLALGDRGYADFCGFGRRLDGWLRLGGGRPLFARVELDGEDLTGQLHWHQALAAMGARAGLVCAGEPQPFAHWRLVERERLNPDDPEHPMYRLWLVPEAAAMLRWQAGDLVEILPPLRPGDSGPRKFREYSIASLPEQGGIELWVRQLFDEQGRLGLGSGWLTDRAPLKTPLALRIRSNPMFHPPVSPGPMLLIGSGTGIAGLLAQLRHRQQLGCGAPTWLLYGERRAAEGRAYRQQLEAMRDAGLIDSLQLVYSRDGQPPCYVQHGLIEQEAALREWLAEGASIYVCGRLHEMANEVERCLQHLLGVAALDALAVQGRYRRDVY